MSEGAPAQPEILDDNQWAAAIRVHELLKKRTRVPKRDLILVVSAALIGSDAMSLLDELSRAIDEPTAPGVAAARIQDAEVAALRRRFLAVTTTRRPEAERLLGVWQQHGRLQIDSEVVLPGHRFPTILRRP